MKVPALGSMISISSTHVCAVVGATRRTSATRAAAAEEYILRCESVEGCEIVECWGVRFGGIVCAGSVKKVLMIKEARSGRREINMNNRHDQRGE